MTYCRVISAVLLSLALAPAAFAVTAQECQALIALYDATGGDQWTNRTGWKGAEGTECSWFGVTCEGSTVIGLFFDSNNMVGTLPDLRGLSGLLSLVIAQNRISGPVPQIAPGISAVTLSFNELTGRPAFTIPPFPGTDMPDRQRLEPGSLDNSVRRDGHFTPRTSYVPGAFANSTTPTQQHRRATSR